MDNTLHISSTKRQPVLLLSTNLTYDTDISIVTYIHGGPKSGQFRKAFYVTKCLVLYLEKIWSLKFSVPLLEIISSTVQGHSHTKLCIKIRRCRANGCKYNHS